MFMLFNVLASCYLNCLLGVPTESILESILKINILIILKNIRKYIKNILESKTKSDTSSINKSNYLFCLSGKQQTKYKFER